MPVRVNLPEGVTITSVSAGYFHSLALASDGQVYGWGWNTSQQVTGGPGPDQLSPVAVELPTGNTYISVDSGRLNSYVLTDEGDIFSWGQNEVPQAGAGAGGAQTGVVRVQAKIAVTGVTFDGLPGAAPGDPASTLPSVNEEGNWSVISPAHPAGPVDVTVSWTLHGVEQDPITYPGAFTYYATAAPTVTDPADMTVIEGKPASFAVNVTGEPAPEVTWEVSADGGATWNPVTEGVSADGLIVSLASVELAQSGNQYRATATNEVAGVTSTPATLTVRPAPVAPTVTSPENATVVEGESASFTVGVTGVPEPEVAWEVSTDRGATWVPVSAGLSEDGLTLTVASVELAQSGNRYRATATNEVATVTSEPATLVVKAPAPVVEQETGKHLAETGMDVPARLWLAGVTALILGGGLVAGFHLVRRGVAR